MRLRVALLALCPTLALLLPAAAQEPLDAGTIKGTVVDRATQQPLAGATVQIVDRTLGAVADEAGHFTVAAVPAGVYNLRISMLGYEAAVHTDVVVRPRRLTTVDIALGEQAVQIQEAVVSADYFADVQDEPVSTVSFGNEEIRRSPGSAGDISRLLQAMPAVSMATDQRNDLIVRGGSPAENLVVVDNVEVPSINHFPTQGASGGPIGLLNIDLINDVRFSAGGFSAAYGDRMSSVLDIDLREGNRDEMDGQANLDMAGAGFVVEGPLASGRGSWLTSARRSYLELIVDAIGTGAVPRYSDVQSKLVYDLSDAHRLSLVQLSGFDAIDFKPDDADESSDFTDVTINQHVVGANWRWLWSAQGYANTSLAFSYAGYNLDVHAGQKGQSERGSLLYSNDSQERELTLRSSFSYRLRHGTDLDWGLVARRLLPDYGLFFASDTNRVGQTTPQIQVSQDVRTSKVGLYAILRQSAGQHLTATAGLRYEYFDLNEETDVAPRLSLTWTLDDRTSLSAAYGIYYQNLAPSLLVQDPRNLQLGNPRADHYVVSLSRRLTPSTLLTVESYLKDYTQLPLDPNDPTYCVLDGYAEYGSPTSGQLVGGGKARSCGIETLVQKKLARDLYGSASYSYSVSRYTDLLGDEHNRSFDNRHLLSLIAGYRRSERWEYSLRWSFAGGRPYTPFDLVRSAQLGMGIVDATRVNALRHPAYHRLDLRLDHRQHYRHCTVISYFTVENAYNRHNLFAYYWDEDKQRAGRIDQWSCLPVGGFEIEF